MGRDDVMERLRDAIPRAANGRGGLLLLGGESGVGKTRIANELAAEARRLGTTVLVGECQPGSPSDERTDRGTPLRSLQKPLQAVADRCRAEGAATAERLLGSRAAILAAYVPDLAGLPGLEAHPVPPELPWKAARIRVLDALARTLVALSNDTPVFLILDDLQWADDLTLALLIHLLRTGNLDDHPLSVLALYRSEEIDVGLQGLLDRPEVGRIDLGRLSEHAVGSLVSAMMAVSPAPPPLTRFLVGQSEGNPFYVAEYLRAAVADGILVRGRKGRWQAGSTIDGLEQLPVPGSIRDLVRRRLGSLSPSERKLLDVAAVVGSEPAVDVLTGAAKMPEEEMAGAVRTLLARNLLEEPSPGRLRFAHDRIREVAYADISAEVRPALHRATAESIDAQPGGTREERLAELGSHWEQAGELQSARACYLGAARRAVVLCSLQDAEKLYRQYLNLVDSPTSESVAARRELGRQVLVNLGRAEEAREEYLTALREAVALKDVLLEASVRGVLGCLLIGTGNGEEAEEALCDALSIFRSEGDRRAEGQALGNLALLRQLHGRLEDARVLSESALEIFRQSDSRRDEGIELMNYGNLHAADGRLDAAVSAYRRAREILDEVGDRRRVGYLLVNLGVACYGQEKLGEARAHFQEAIAVSRQVGDLPTEAIALANLANLYGQQSRIEEAAALNDRALGIQRALGNLRVVAAILSGKAELELRAGRHEEACRLAMEALQVVRELGDRRLEATTLIELARIERRLSRPDSARSRVVAALELLAEDEGARREQALCWIERGHIALAVGQPADDDFRQAASGVEELAVEATSDLASKLDQLRRAMERSARGQPLVQGEDPDAISRAIKIVTPSQGR